MSVLLTSSDHLIYLIDLAMVEGNFVFIRPTSRTVNGFFVHNNVVVNQLVKLQLSSYRT